LLRHATTKQVSIRQKNRDMNLAMAASSTPAKGYMHPFDASQDDYDRLPEPIKLSYTRAEYLWLSDEEKASLEQKECEPEW